jgi:hypothetical protein
VKYLFKYTNKGFDSARVGFHQAEFNAIPVQSPSTALSANGVDTVAGIDEIAEYVRSRYLSLCESFWRLFGFEIHGKNSSVERLCVHLPGMNFVTLRDESNLANVIDEPSYSQSQLTEWLVANQRSSSGHALTYSDVPTYVYLGG